MNHSHTSITRRSLFGGAATLAGAGLATGCSNKGRGGIPATLANAPFQPPRNIPFDAVTPDLPGDPKTGLLDAYFRYPKKQVKAVTTPPGDGKPVSAVTQTFSPVPPRLRRNSFWQQLNSRLGSDLKINTVPSGEWDQKFATIVAGDALPDVFFVGAMPRLPQFLDASALDLSPYLVGDKVKDYPFLANIPPENWQETGFNGKIMTIPIHRGRLTTFAMAMRADLFEKHGITDQPSSFADFTNMCKEVSNPKKNVWALGGAPLDFIRQMLGIPNVWDEKDGKLTHMYEAEGQEEALDAVVKLSEAGVLNPDAFTGPDTKTWFGSGRILLTWEWMSSWEQFYREQTSGPDFRMQAMLPPAFESGITPHTWLGGPNFGLSAISQKAEKRIETVLNVLNYLAAPFGSEEYTFLHYGQEGVHHTLDHGSPVLTSTGNSQIPLGIEYLSNAPKVIYLQGLEEAARILHDDMKTITDRGVPDPTFGLYSETASRIGASLDDSINNTANDIMQKRKPVSAWKDAVKTWKKNGGDTIRSELEKALAERESGQ